MDIYQRINNFIFSDSTLRALSQITKAYVLCPQNQCATDTVSVSVSADISVSVSLSVSADTDFYIGS